MSKCPICRSRGECDEDCGVSVEELKDRITELEKALAEQRQINQSEELLNTSLHRELKERDEQLRDMKKDMSALISDLHDNVDNDTQEWYEAGLIMEKWGVE